MTRGHSGTYASLALLIACVPGCKENEPTPSHYADLGEEGRPLVPTSSPVHNAKIGNGSADWHPFRTPEIRDENDAAPAPTAREGGAAANGETTAAIREAVADYNDTLANGSTEDLLGFLTDEQGGIAEALLPTLASLNTKLGELATAIPAQAAAIETVRSQLGAASLLKIDIASIKSAGLESATVTLPRSPLPAFLPGLTEDAKAATDIKFSLGDDEYWYIESPILTALGGIEPTLKRVITEINGLGSGADGAALDATATLAPMLKAAATAPEPAETPTAQDAPTAAPDQGNGG